jgi:hypothetical protein
MLSPSSTAARSRETRDWRFGISSEDEIHSEDGKNERWRDGGSSFELCVGQTATVVDGLGDVPKDVFGKVGVVVGIVLGHHRLVIGVLS